MHIYLIQFSKRNLYFLQKLYQFRFESIVYTFFRYFLRLVQIKPIHFRMSIIAVTRSVYERPSREQKAD